jgi:hypothetical protein
MWSWGVWTWWGGYCVYVWVRRILFFKEKNRKIKILFSSSEGILFHPVIDIHPCIHSFTLSLSKRDSRTFKSVKKRTSRTVDVFSWFVVSSEVFRGCVYGQDYLIHIVDQKKFWNEGTEKEKTLPTRCWKLKVYTRPSHVRWIMKKKLWGCVCVMDFIMTR